MSFNISVAVNAVISSDLWQLNVALFIDITFQVCLILLFITVPFFPLRFRIAAVYANNDNTLGPNSRRFLLKKTTTMKRPPFSPTIIRLIPQGPTSVKLEWQYSPSPGVPIEGFLISYREATVAREYTKVRSYWLTVLVCPCPVSLGRTSVTDRSKELGIGPCLLLCGSCCGFVPET